MIMEGSYVLVNKIIHIDWWEYTIGGDLEVKNRDLALYAWTHILRNIILFIHLFGFMVSLENKAKM